MIDWVETEARLGITIEQFNSLSHVDKCKTNLIFKCDNCAVSYIMSYKTIKDRKRCKRTGCKYCKHKIYIDETKLDKQKRFNNYVKLHRKKFGKRNYERIFDSFDRFIRMKVSAALAEDKNKGRIGDITKKSIIELLEHSNKRCMLTGVDLDHNRNSLYSLSIDRINSNVAHLINNVQLVCRGINIAKNNASNEDIKFVLDCLIGRTNFVPNMNSRDYISKIVRNLKQYDNNRHLTNDINTDYIIDLYNMQDGLCMLSGIQMCNYKHPCLSTSIDRIDNSVGHIKSNIRLVTKFVNRSKSTFNDDEYLLWLSDVKEKYAKFNK